MTVLKVNEIEKPRMTHVIGTYATGLIRIGLGAVLVYSSLSKIQNPFVFLESIYQFEILGPKGSLAVAVILPFLEVTIGFCLLAGMATRAALACSVGLFAFFACVLSSVVYRGLTTSCGCFGGLAEAMVTWSTVGRTAGLCLLACIGLALDFWITRRNLLQVRA